MTTGFIGKTFGIFPQTCLGVRIYVWHNVNAHLHLKIECNFSFTFEVENKNKSSHRDQEDNLSSSLIAWGVNPR